MLEQGSSRAQWHGFMVHFLCAAQQNGVTEYAIHIEVKTDLMERC